MWTIPFGVLTLWPRWYLHKDRNITWKSSFSGEVEGRLGKCLKFCMNFDSSILFLKENNSKKFNFFLFQLEEVVWFQPPSLMADPQERGRMYQFWKDLRWGVCRTLWQAKYTHTRIHTHELYATEGYKAKEESLEFLQAVSPEIYHEKHVLSLL